MSTNRTLNSINVHCRIGSLEITASIREGLNLVHCRIGSLENHRLALSAMLIQFTAA